MPYSTNNIIDFLHCSNAYNAHSSHQKSNYGIITRWNVVKASILWELEVCMVHNKNQKIISNFVEYTQSSMPNNKQWECTHSEERTDTAISTSIPTRLLLDDNPVSSSLNLTLALSSAIPLTKHFFTKERRVKGQSSFKTDLKTNLEA